MSVRVPRLTDSLVCDNSHPPPTMSSPKLPHVLLFGLGGIGGVYACILSLSKRCRVSVVARSNYTAVKDKGYFIKSSKFGDHDDIRFDGGECVAWSAGVSLGHVLDHRGL